jgi:SAM-dependent methyltransferase
VRLRARRPGEPGPRKQVQRVRHVLKDSAMAYDAFAPVYDVWFPGVDDVPFYVSLAREADGPIVELAVGTGRVAGEVARETGKRVIGVDASAAMLARASERYPELDLRHGDMRGFELEEPAALVYCPARSLLHLPTWDDKLLVFRRVFDALRPGGRWAFNAFVFHHQIAARLEGEHRDEPVPHRNDYFPGDSRIDLTLLENGARVSLWWCTKNEWLGLLQTAGFEVEALYGDFERTPFTEASGEFVFVARRPAS